MVQETANSGFAYTMFGFCCVGIACLAVLGIVLAMRRINETSLRGIVMGWLIAAVCVFAITGFIVMLANLSNWIAPTKQVVREVMTYIQ